MDGVFFVDLADVSEIGLVAAAVAQSLGLQERGGHELSETVLDYLRERRILLVLDNVERVVEAGPELNRWLAAAPDAKILATSRIPFRLAGEQEYPVPPLPGEAAVELFAERARAIRPDFVLNGNRALVAEICARLDDLPLAIELAAARVKLLPPAKLLERLDQRLPVLTGGARDAPERHRTLRAAIDWSFGLLDLDEQTLFARLSVFAGGFTLEAAEAVCDAPLDGLASLVEKSLLTQRQGTGGDPRFTLLETVREYAREQLEQRGEADTMADSACRLLPRTRRGHRARTRPAPFCSRLGAGQSAQRPGASADDGHRARTSFRNRGLLEPLDASKPARAEGVARRGPRAFSGRRSARCVREHSARWRWRPTTSARSSSHANTRVRASSLPESSATSARSNGRFECSASTSPT